MTKVKWIVIMEVIVRATDKWDAIEQVEKSLKEKKVKIINANKINVVDAEEVD